MTDTEPTPPAVSPVDTAALREQVATTLEERIGDNSDLYETVDDVLAVVSPLLSVSAHREGQAVARQAVLRADLGKAQRQIELLKAEVGYRSGVEAHLKLENDMLRVASRPAIPSNALGQLWLYLNGWLPAHLDRPIDSMDDVAEALASRLMDDVLSQWSAPTTGPAPAAADGEVRALLVHPAAWNRLVDWLTSRGLTVDAHGALEEIPAYSMGISDELARATGVTPAVPQAPAEPTEDGGHRVAVKQSTTDRLFLMADCKDCPDSYGGDARKVADWAVGHSIATTPPAGPAAREDTAPTTTKHKVTVSVPLGGPASARCDFCSLGTTGTEQEVDDWADRHRADTLRPSGPFAPIRHEEE